MIVRVIIALGVGGALGALGVVTWIAWRKGRTVQAGALGPLSPPTLAVVAISCLAVGYHAVAHGLSLATLKAPMWIAALAGISASAIALALDMWERRSDAREDREPRE